MQIEVPSPKGNIVDQVVSFTSNKMTAADWRIVSKKDSSQVTLLQRVDVDRQMADNTWLMLKFIRKKVEAFQINDMIQMAINFLNWTL